MCEAVAAVVAAAISTIVAHDVVVCCGFCSKDRKCERGFRPMTETQYMRMMMMGEEEVGGEERELRTERRMDGRRTRNSLRVSRHHQRMRESR